MSLMIYSLIFFTNQLVCFDVSVELLFILCPLTTSCRYLASVYQKTTLICHCCWLLQLVMSWGPGLLNGVSRIIEGTGKIYLSLLPGKLKEIKKPVPIKHAPSLFSVNAVPQSRILLVVFVEARRFE